MKKLLFSQRGGTPHWVGDGFPVRSIFSYNENKPQDISPFLLMDYGGPVHFEPSKKRRGVGEHPHRGFETVTIVYSGEVEHRDSAGGGGKIGPGDVQWMTAASGLVHEEKHSRLFSETGGVFEMVQLWVNLPAKDKMSPPKYQGLLDSEIPRVDLPDGAGHLRVIAGEFAGHRAPGTTFTPIHLWDRTLHAGKTVDLMIEKNFNTLIFVLKGSAQLGSGEIISAAELARLDSSDDSFSLKAFEDAKILVLAGEPIAEPVVGYGPFVMNSGLEIRRAMEDFEKGLMGDLNAFKRD